MMNIDDTIKSGHNLLRVKNNGGLYFPSQGVEMVKINYKIM